MYSPPPREPEKGKRKGFWPYFFVLAVLIFSGTWMGSYLLHREYEDFQITSIPVDVSREPLQTEAREEGVVWEINHKGDHYKVVITPLYEYDISGKVVSVRKWRSWEESGCPVWKEVFPLDFALTWGKVAEEKYARYIKFYHTPASRFVHWKYNFPAQGPSLSQRYLESHISNNHLCPANETIRYALKKVKKGDRVRIEGWLMYMELFKDNQKLFSARSSTTRKDTWGGACESIYVKRIQIQERIYE